MPCGKCRRPQCSWVPATLAQVQVTESLQASIDALQAERERLLQGLAGDPRPSAQLALAEERLHLAQEQVQHCNISIHIGGLCLGWRRMRCLFSAGPFAIHAHFQDTVPVLTCQVRSLQEERLGLREQLEASGLQAAAVEASRDQLERAQHHVRPSQCLSVLHNVVAADILACTVGHRQSGQCAIIADGHLCATLWLGQGPDHGGGGAAAGAALCRARACAGGGRLGARAHCAAAGERRLWSVLPAFQAIMHRHSVSSLLCQSPSSLHPFAVG